jgi:hypothetical protein
MNQGQVPQKATLLGYLAGFRVGARMNEFS